MWVRKQRQRIATLPFSPGIILSSIHVLYYQLSSSSGIYIERHSVIAKTMENSYHACHVAVSL
jgi:hypothetical protein